MGTQCEAAHCLVNISLLSQMSGSMSLRKRTRSGALPTHGHFRCAVPLSCLSLCTPNVLIIKCVPVNVLLAMGRPHSLDCSLPFWRARTLMAVTRMAMSKFAQCSVCQSCSSRASARKRGWADSIQWVLRTQARLRMLHHMRILWGRFRILAALTCTTQAAMPRSEDIAAIEMAGALKGLAHCWHGHLPTTCIGILGAGWVHNVHSAPSPSFKIICLLCSWRLWARFVLMLLRLSPSGGALWLRVDPRCFACALGRAPLLSIQRIVQNPGGPTPQTLRSRRVPDAPENSQAD